MAQTEFVRRERIQTAGLDGNGRTGTAGDHRQNLRGTRRSEAQTRCAGGKVAVLCRRMRTVAQELSPARPDFVRVVTEVFGRDLEEGALEMYPNRTEVAELSEQVRAAKGKLETLAKSLRELGVTV